MFGVIFPFLRFFSVFAYFAFICILIAIPSFLDTTPVVEDDTVGAVACPARFAACFNHFGKGKLR